MDNVNTAPAGEAPVATDAPTNLPSDVDNRPKSFSFDEGELQEGKYQGKWESPKQMAEHIKSIEDKYANLQRDLKNGEKQTISEIEQVKAEADTAAKRKQTIDELLPKFMQNGMALDDEMMARLQEVGMSETEIKLGAYELKEAMDKNASYVGGKENYDIIMDYHAKTMTPEEKIAFNHSIQDPKNSKALMLGLKVMYEQNSGVAPQEDTTDRVRGQVASQGIQPYSSKTDLLRDKKFADSRLATDADRAKYRARLNITPENVWKN